MLNFLEWCGAIGGAAGALLLACNNRWSGYGFVLFLASNAAWTIYGFLTHTYGLIAMQIVCTATSLLGVWRWLLRPRWSRFSGRRGGNLVMLPADLIVCAGRPLGAEERGR